MAKATLETKRQRKHEQLGFCYYFDAKSGIELVDIEDSEQKEAHKGSELLPAMTTKDVVDSETQKCGERTVI